MQMGEIECNALKELISSRVNFAILKMKDKHPRYQEVCKHQEEKWQSIDVILRQLEDDDRRAVLRYYEDEVHRFGFEFDGTYLQGIKDCINVLVFFGVLGQLPRT